MDVNGFLVNFTLRNHFQAQGAKILETAFPGALLTIFGADAQQFAKLACCGHFGQPRATCNACPENITRLFVYIPCSFKSAREIHNRTFAAVVVGFGADATGDL